MSIYFYWAETHRTSPMFRRSAFKRWASKMTLNASESPHFCYRQFNVMTFFISVECLTLYSFCKWYTFTISLEDLSVDCIMVTLFFFGKEMTVPSFIFFDLKISAAKDAQENWLHVFVLFLPLSISWLFYDLKAYIQILCDTIKLYRLFALPVTFQERPPFSCWSGKGGGRWKTNKMREGHSTLGFRYYFI